MDAITPEQIRQWLEEHKQLFYSGRTRTRAFRERQLLTLRNAVQRHEEELLAALRADLGKSAFEGYATEVGFVLSSLTYSLKRLKRWMKPRGVKTPLFLLPARSRIVPEPYGTVLIVGPFNYPVQLLLEPLIGAIAAGNCAVLKPSEHTPAVSAVIRRIVEESFEPAYIRVVEGEKEVVSALIHAPFDYIFFTGSVPTGKIVMEAAAKNLTPVTLELGGKSPVIVERSANLELAAERIIWGKLTNAGQTCIAPDYVLVHQDIKGALIGCMKKAIVAFYGADARLSEDYGRIVNDKQFLRLSSIISRDRDRIVYGGASVQEERYIEPTLLAGVTWQDASMEDEIFGPLLPILGYDRLEEAVHAVRQRPKPLALYLFTENKDVERTVLEQLSFGGGCINDTIYHVASPFLPFGGVGPSGIGAYHGKASFDTFTHRKSILKRSTRIQLKLALPPYGDKLRLIRRVLK
ncbi:MAG: aldehyde dehydrogenase [Paenibacillaceae bacterium]|nr:aldehyde dehydrogenase [Paenibacillaceae bacterium]